MTTTRHTTAQALLRFLAHQHTERDGRRDRLIAGVWGIFGHGNVAGLGQALQEHGEAWGMPFYRPQNEQGQVHAAVAYARHRRRLSAMACTASIGPGSTNMLTGAALATINRIPVLLLPSDYFANRAPDPALQQLEHPTEHDASVNDAFRPLSRFFARITRPEQLLHALPEAMRVLADPAETGAVTLSLPEDVQAEAWDWPEAFFAPRTWRVRRPPPEPDRVQEAADRIAGARHPILVAGGGVKYAAAEDALAALVDALGLPVVETQAGKGAIPWDHPLSLGPVGATGGSAGNAAAAEADVVLAVGTRLADFTTASHTAFAPDATIVGINVAPMDAAKLRGVQVVADARVALEAIAAACRGRVADGDVSRRRDRARDRKRRWDAQVDAFRSGAPGSTEGPAATGRPVGAAVAGSPPAESAGSTGAESPGSAAAAGANGNGASALPTQARAIGLANEVYGTHATMICAAGSMPGDLHKLWRAADPRAYHVEYGYSCMGYEIPAGIGVALAEPEREVLVMIGDGSYLMMNSELVTAVVEGIDMTVVLVDNHGFQSIHGLQRSVGTPHFGLELRARDPETGRLDGPVVAVDYVRHAEAMGARTWRARDERSFRQALEEAREARGVRVVVVEVDKDARLPSHENAGWWDVPVAEVSGQASVQEARAAYEANVAKRRRSP